MLNGRTGSLRRLHTYAAGLALAGAALLTGCSLATTSAPQDAISGLNGQIHGGQQPVKHATITLYATNSTVSGAAGYSATPTFVASTTTDDQGNWQLGTYTNPCPGTEQAYLVGTGGDPGNGTNSALMLVAALGSCSSIGASTYVDMNEVTTVAAAYALSGFAPAGGANFGTNTAGFATSSTNTQGLVDAFANANNIVDFSTGLARTAPLSNSNGLVPQSTIHALADILQDCVNSTGPGSPACTSLFNAATPPAGSGIAAPANTFQAALDIAQYPGNNVGTLFGLISAQAAFSTSLTSAPNDWTIGVVYTTPIVSSAGLGVGGDDTVYVTGKNYMVHFSAQGGVISGTNIMTGLASGDTLRYTAFDSTGNLFSTDDSQAGVWGIKSGTPAFMSYNVAPVSDTDKNNYGIAVDKLGDVWTMSYSKATCASVSCTLVEYVAGNSYAPVSSFSSTTVGAAGGGAGGARGLFFDVNTGNLWYTSISDNKGAVVNLTPVAGAAATLNSGPSTLTNLGVQPTTASMGTISVAVGKSGQAWFLGTGDSGVSAVASLTPATYSGGTVTQGTTVTGGGMSAPQQVIVDGNNNLFVSSTVSSSIVQYSPGFNSNAGAFLSPGTTGFIPSGTPLGTAPSTIPSLYQPQYLQVDRSGALWTASSGSGSATKPANLIQILGVAAPTDPVQANGNYGVKP